MDSNQICKMKAEESMKNLSIPLDKMYSPHFEYKDMVSRLNRLINDKILTDRFACYGMTKNTESKRRAASYELLLRTELNCVNSKMRKANIRLPVINTCRQARNKRKFIEYLDNRIGKKRVKILLK